MFTLTYIISLAMVLIPVIVNRLALKDPHIEASQPAMFAIGVYTALIVPWLLYLYLSPRAAATFRRAAEQTSQ